MCKKIVSRIIIVLLAMLFAMSIALCEQSTWNCPDCDRTGNTGYYCGGCGHPAPWMLVDKAETEDIIEHGKGLECKVGDNVIFGHYPQTANGKDNTPIEWLVLDVQEENALLISKYALDCQPYNKLHANVTWETCTLRQWLNRDFYNAAFNEKEKNAIITTSIVNIDSLDHFSNIVGEEETEDDVFLLSLDEAEKYYADDDSRKCQVTEYAVTQGAFKTSKDSLCWWWLRSIGYHLDTAYDVSDYGILGMNSNVKNDSVAIRPALWVYLKSEIFQSEIP